MATSTVVNVNGKWYVADASGCLTPIPKNGWVLAGSDYYYAEDGGLVTNEIRKINGAYYAFDNDGKMLANGEAVCNLVTCRARANGSLYVSEWYQDVKGNWYYFDAASRVVSGWQIINGVKYYFNTEYDTIQHAMVTGYCAIDKKLYYFDTSGACQGVCGPQTGWYQAGEDWYYMRGGCVVTGSNTIDGNQYYFDSNGVLVPEW